MRVCQDGSGAEWLELEEKRFVLTAVESRAARVISRFPLRPTRAGTRMKTSVITLNTSQCWNTHSHGKLDFKQLQSNVVHTENKITKHPYVKVIWTWCSQISHNARRYSKLTQWPTFWVDEYYNVGSQADVVWVLAGPRSLNNSDMSRKRRNDGKGGETDSEKEIVCNWMKTMKAEKDRHRNRLE